MAQHTLPRLVATALGLALGLSTPAAAQQPSDPSSLDPAGFAPTAQDLILPIHRAPGDAEERVTGTVPLEAQDREPWWASGPDYKVAFGSGYTFHPVLGPDAPRSLPLRWQTRSVTVGGIEVADLGARTTRAAGWRYEQVADGLVEAYDVLPEGVEQTFVLTHRPRGRGDFVVSGAFETELRCADRPARHGAVEFMDPEGRTVVTYGAATVFDAAGRTAPVPTAVTDGVVTMTVPGAWLARATYPVTLDPLTFGTRVNYSLSNTPASSTAIAVTQDSATSNVMLVFTRAISAVDHDIFAVSMNADWTDRRTIYADPATGAKDTDAQVAYVAGANRWVIGMQRNYVSRTGTEYATVRLHYHDLGNPLLNSGLGASIANIGGHFTRPALGGTSANSVYGLLVYQLESTPNNGLDSEVVVAPIRASTRQVLSAYIAGDAPVGTALDREAPTVNPVSDGDGWVVAWGEQRRSFITDDFDVYAVRTNDVGAKAGSVALLASGGARHARAPRIAGRSDGYYLAYEKSESLVRTATIELAARRVDWSPRSATPTIGPERTIAAIGSALAGSMTMNGMAYDSRTRSHTVITWTYRRALSTSTAHVARLGGTGAALERATLYSSSVRDARHPTVAYNSRDGRFECVYTVDVQAYPYHPIYAAHFNYPSDAVSAPYGSSCSRARVTSGFPYVGNREFAVHLRSAPANASAAMLLSLRADNRPLGGFGMTGCTLLVDLGLFLVGPSAVTDPRGSAAVDVPLPDVPGTPADLFAQWLYVERGANAANVVTTQGLRMQIR